MVRHFLVDDDLSPAELNAVLDLADEFRAERYAYRPLEGPKSVAVVFDKPSTRTRVSFSAGIAELGGHPIVIDKGASQLGRGEPVGDTVQVLDRICSAIVWRTFEQATLSEAAAVSSVPVINALTDMYHPCQLLADLLTVRSRKGSLAGRTLTYAGDGGNNMAHSYLLAGAAAGMHVRIASPEGFVPDPAIVQRAAAIAERTGGSVAHVTDPSDGFKGADALATDTWVSMGQEDESARREAVFVPFALTPAAVAAAADPVVLHCLPAYRGKEIAAEVIDGPNSAVWDEAENRLHTQKALLTWLLQGDDAAAGGTA
jgi:ornithine carbamoyltransferase